MTSDAWRGPLTALAAALLAGCGPGLIEELPSPEAEGEVVADDGTGDTVAEPDPSAALCPAEPCEIPPLEPDAGAEEPDAGTPGATAPADAGAAADAGLAPDGGAPGSGAVTADGGARADAGPGTGAADAGPDLWAAGAKVLVRGYTSFRSAARPDAPVVSAVDPAGGVTDSAHGGGMPRGLVPPGQVVTLSTGTRTNGFYQVRYAGQVGWVAASWLAAVDPAKSRYELALAAGARNAFFKNQLHRTRWNKDGPYSSGTCAPASLAMAIHAVGKEPAALSVEESIHRVRQSYGATSDSTGTFRAQITTAATRLGMAVRVLDTRLSAADMLTRLDGQLAATRMVVLEGQPSSGGAYQQAFNRAYQAAGVTSRYTFSGRHSVLVLGRDGARYVVGDPLSEVGMVTLTAAELRAFFTTWGGTGNAVWAPR